MLEFEDDAFPHNGKFEAVAYGKSVVKRRKVQCFVELSGGVLVVQSAVFGYEHTADDSRTKMVRQPEDYSAPPLMKSRLCVEP